MRDLMPLVTSGQTGIKDYLHAGKQMIAGFAPVSNTKWRVAITESEQEFLEKVTVVRNKIILVMLYGSSFIVAPIKKAAESLLDIAQGEGNLTKRLQITLGHLPS